MLPSTLDFLTSTLDFLPSTLDPRPKPRLVNLKFDSLNSMETQKKARGTSQSKPRQMASKTCANNLRVSCECRVKKLFTAVLPKRVYKTHTPCIHYHLRDKSHRSHHGFIKRARQTPSLLTLSPFPLFLH